MPTSPDDRITALERAVSRLQSRLGEQRYRDKRDGRAVLSVRVGDELAALVRLTARRQGRRISDLLRPAILAAVNQPSTEHLAELPPDRGLHMHARKLAAPSIASDRALIRVGLAERARLAAADAAATADRRPRAQQDKNPGMMTEMPNQSSLLLRGR
jgi:hypothetical protein